MNMTAPKRLVMVSAAILINKERQILLAQRPEGKPLAGLWEFPGGKIEPGETAERALCRELAEELDITTREEDLEPFTFVSEETDKFHLLMLLYCLEKWDGILKGREGQAFKWVSATDLKHHAMPKPDLPLIPKLEEYFKKISES